MALTLDGTTGVSAVQAGAVESGDLPAGSVIQVVSEHYSDIGVQTTSTTFVDTGFSASITPLSINSKILVICIMGGLIKKPNNTAMTLRLVSPGYSALTQLTGLYDESNSYLTDFEATLHKLHEPSTTTSVTYNIEFKSSTGDRVEIMESPFGDTSDSTITLMEIAG